MYTVEAPIRTLRISDTIEITSEQRTSFNVPNGDFPIVPIKDNLSTKDKMAGKQWVPNVSVIRRFHCIRLPSGGLGGAGVSRDRVYI